MRPPHLHQDSRCAWVFFLVSWRQEPSSCLSNAAVPHPGPVADSYRKTPYRVEWLQNARLPAPKVHGSVRIVRGAGLPPSGRTLLDPQRLGKTERRAQARPSGRRRKATRTQKMGRCRSAESPMRELSFCGRDCQFRVEFSCLLDVFNIVDGYLYAGTFGSKLVEQPYIFHLPDTIPRTGVEGTQ